MAIGDSHTYGYNVERQDSWPALVARHKQLSVYVYSNGGYGILHYRWLFDQALTRKPKYVVVGLYLANDLEDYCRYARRSHSHWKPLSIPKGRSKQHMQGTFKRVFSRRDHEHRAVQMAAHTYRSARLVPTE